MFIHLFELDLFPHMTETISILSTSNSLQLVPTSLDSRQSSPSCFIP
jgi:hypothetical protein